MDSGDRGAVFGGGVGGGIVAKLLGATSYISYIAPIGIGAACAYIGHKVFEYYGSRKPPSH